MDTNHHPPCCGAADPIPLTELPPMTPGCIRRLEAPEGEMDRLKAMGLCVGRKVMLLRQGDPLLVKLFGSRLALSRALATGITVERLDPSACGAFACPGSSA